MSQPIRNVVVVGSGVAALMAAVALARRVPGLGVTLVDGGTGHEVLEDVIGAARPGLQAFHHAMGVVGGGLWRRIGARPRLATQMVGFGPAPFFRAHALAPSQAGVPLHQLCAAAGLQPRALGDLALAAACAAPVDRDLRQGAASPLMGYFLDLAAYRQALEGLAASAGIRFESAEGLSAEPTADRAGVARLRLPSGRTLEADLFIDASGRAAIVRGALPSAWTSWRASLPIDRLAPARTEDDQDAAPFDRIAARADGWRYEQAGLRLEAWRTPEQAPSAQGGPPEDSAVSLHQGRLQEPFFGNVVAIGAAAVALEPIAVSGLDLVCRHLDRLLALWPGREISAVERELYNRGAGIEADHAHDFARLHYTMSARAEPFWQAARAAPLSPDLTHDLALFGERGRLGHRQDDSVTAEERILVLTGLGLAPRRVDTLSGLLTPDAAAATLRQVRRHLGPGVANFKSAWLEPSLAREAS